MFCPNVQVWHWQTFELLQLLAVAHVLPIVGSPLHGDLNHRRPFSAELPHAHHVAVVAE